MGEGEKYLVEMGRIAIDVHRDVINLNGLVTPPMPRGN
jgi:hypothetical protein